MEELTGLARARSDLAEASERLTRLKEALAGAEPDPVRPQRWRALRRLLEMTRETLSAWAPRPRSDGAGDPALWRSASELQARGLKAESALQAVEKGQRKLDDERASVLAELERVHEGWRLLRLRCEREPQAGEGALRAPELFERWYAVLSAASQALEEERAVQADARDAEKLWRWLLDAAFPTLERLLREQGDTLVLPTLRRLLAEQDRRWSQARRLWADQAAERSLKAFDDLQLRCSELENELRRTEVASAQRERALCEELERAARLTAQAQAERDLAASEPQALRQQNAGLANELEQANRARAGVARLTSQLEGERRRGAEAESALQAARSDLQAAHSELEALRAAAATPPAAPEPPKAPPPPQAETKPAPPVEPQQPVPSVEPPLEPGWQVVLERLRQPLAAAAAQLRRLHAAPMPANYKAVARLASRALAQASDTVKSVKEFLDEGAAPSAVGHVDAAIEAALASWEPVFARHGVRLTREIGRGLPAVPASSESLRIAVYQLLRNALEAMPRGGSLTVAAVWDEQAGEVRATFADAGPGFSEQSRERLFVPFESSKLGHLGLGLALARRIARRSGGEVEAGATPQGGALVTLRLPRA